MFVRILVLPFAAFIARMCFCSVVHFQMIYQIDFLNEFLLAHHTTILPIIRMDFGMHTQTASIFHSVVLRAKRIEKPFKLYNGQLTPNQNIFVVIVSDFAQNLTRNLYM